MSTSTSKTKSLHLLRALLREATYLPDAHARHYFGRYIVARFKAYQPKHRATASFDVHALDKYRHRTFKRRHVGIIAARTSRQQQKASKGLHYLRRANHGELPCLQKVLYFAYGRMGRRKYALLDDLLMPDPVIDGNAVLPARDFTGPTPLQERYYSDKRFLHFFDAPKEGPSTMYTIGISNRYSRLQTVLRSQNQLRVSIHKELKGHVIKTPMHNTWMRPMPIKRARNNVRRWYAQTMTRLLPPLPHDEWDNLHAMVHREKPISLPKRRLPGTLLVETQIAPEERHLDAMLDSLKLDKPAKAHRSRLDTPPSPITSKFMRRLYSRLLQLCCKVEYNNSHKKWVATWGEATHATSPSIYNAPSDQALFDGVGADGKLARNTQPTTDTDSASKLWPRNEQGEYVRFPFYAEKLPPDNPLRKALDAWKAKRHAARTTIDGGTTP